MFEPNKAKLVAQIAAQLVSGQLNLVSGDSHEIRKIVKAALKIINEAQKQVEEEHAKNV